MAKKRWIVNLDNKEYKIQLNHGYFSGRKTIKVNDEIIYQGKQIFDQGGNYPFKIGSHKLFIEITINGRTFDYDLIVDGISLATGERMVDSGLDEWKEMKRKGKNKYFFYKAFLKNGIGRGSFFAITFTGFMYIINDIEEDHFYTYLFPLLLISIILFSLLGYFEAKSIWNDYQNKYDEK